jgi:hypothetical protein
MTLVLFRFRARDSNFGSSSNLDRPGSSLLHFWPALGWLDSATSLITFSTKRPLRFLWAAFNLCANGIQSRPEIASNFSTKSFHLRRVVTINTQRPSRYEQVGPSSGAIFFVGTILNWYPQIKRHLFLVGTFFNRHLLKKRCLSFSRRLSRSTLVL